MRPHRKFPSKYPFQTDMSLACPVHAGIRYIHTYIICTYSQLDPQNLICQKPPQTLPSVRNINDIPRTYYNHLLILPLPSNYHPAGNLGFRFEEGARTTRYIFRLWLFAFIYRIKVFVAGGPGSYFIKNLSSHVAVNLCFDLGMRTVCGFLGLPHTLIIKVLKADILLGRVNFKKVSIQERLTVFL